MFLKGFLWATRVRTTIIKQEYTHEMMGWLDWQARQVIEGLGFHLMSLSEIDVEALGFSRPQPKMWHLGFLSIAVVND